MIFQKINYQEIRYEREQLKMLRDQLFSLRDQEKKNIQVIHASSQTQDATVFDISDKGFTNVSGDFPNIPTVDEKWYQEDGHWKYRLHLAFSVKEIVTTINFLPTNSHLSI